MMTMKHWHYETLMKDKKSFSVCLENKTLCFCRFSCPSSPPLFPNIREFGEKKNFTDHQALNAIHLFVAVKGNYSGLFFF